MRIVGIIGAGQMGSGIAQTIAQNGIKVLLSDVDVALAEKAKAGIDKALTRLVGRDKITPADAEAALSRITPIGDYAAMADADLIIEAATEKEEIKRKIFESAGKVLRAMRSWLRTPARSRSPAWPPARPIPSVSSACTSSIRFRSWA